MRQYVTADACFTLDVPEVETLPHLHLFPNPATVGQTITLNSTKEIATIEIFNEAGRTIDKATSTHFSLPTTGWFVLGITYTDGTKQAAKLFVSQ